MKLQAKEKQAPASVQSPAMCDLPAKNKARQAEEIQDAKTSGQANSHPDSYRESMVISQ